MKPAEFEAEAFRLLGGRGWKTRFCRATATDPSTLRRWLARDEDVPDHAVALIELLRVVPAAMRPSRWLR